MRLPFLFLLAVLPLCLHASDFNPFRTQPQITLTDGRILRTFRIISYAHTGVNATWEGGQGPIAYELLGPEWGEAIARFRPKDPPSAPPFQTSTESRKTPTAKTAPTPATTPAKPNPPVSLPKLDLSPIAAHPEPGSTLFERTISGQCFIVTKGRANMKLGLVRVGVYPKEAFRSYHSEILSRLISYSNAVIQTRKAYGNVQKWPIDLHSDIVQANRHSVWKALPDPVASTLTDADGKFILKHKLSSYVLFAHADRSIGEDREYYIWIIPDSEIGAEDLLFLSNQNLAR